MLRSASSPQARRPARSEPQPQPRQPGRPPRWWALLALFSGVALPGHILAGISLGLALLFGNPNLAPAAAAALPSPDPRADAEGVTAAVLRLTPTQQPSVPGVPDSILVRMDSLEALLAADADRADAPELLYRLGRLKSDHLPRLNVVLIPVGDSSRFASDAEHAALEAYVAAHRAEYDPLGVPSGEYEYNGWHFGELVRRFPEHELAEEAAYRFAMTERADETRFLRRALEFLRERRHSPYAPRVLAAVDAVVHAAAAGPARFEQAGLSGVRRDSENSPCGDRGWFIANSQFGLGPGGLIIQREYGIHCYVGEILSAIRAWTYDGLGGEPLWTILPEWASHPPIPWRAGGDRVYRIPALLCCGNADYGAHLFYSTTTGARLFAATESGSAGRLLEDAVVRVLASSGRRAVVRRFAAFHGADAGGDRGLGPPESRRDGVIGVLQYGDDRTPAARYALHAPADWHVRALRLRSARGTVDDEGRELRLEAAADTAEAAYFDGFSIVVELAPFIPTVRGRPGPEPDGPVELVVPVEADRLAVERALGPPGVRLEPAG